MKLTNYFGVALLLSVIGLFLSGYLSYWNLFGPGCQEGPLNFLISCGGPKKVLIFGLPTCVYGFTMYLIVAITSAVGLYSKQPKKTISTLMGLGLLGTVFSGGLTVYELWILKIKFTSLPACAVGFVLFGGILVSSLLARRAQRRTVMAST